MDDITVFHAGTKAEDGKMLTNGGRVLGVTAVAPDLDAAIKRAYEGVDKISFKDSFFRHDIGIRSTIDMKRTDYISWDEYFMGIALLSACRSKDNNTQVGACIVTGDNKILSLGYNGMR